MLKHEFAKKKTKKKEKKQCCTFLDILKKYKKVFL